MPTEKTKLSIVGARLVSYPRFCDDRGYFQPLDIEVLNSIVDEIKLPRRSFISKSKKKVLRGLHYQKENSLANLVTVLVGEIFDVGVDLRRKSKTFLHVNHLRIDQNSPYGVYWPPGVAHGFLALGETNLLHYSCFGEYCKKLEGGLHFLDKTLNIPWPNSPLIVNDRDAHFRDLSAFIDEDFC
ncbi:dTDP-4-dehydrorhamnose 3,5-epimerase family protein [Planktomarina temperata]|nr:dTDP-4-dehydrorhamnose 3,5-epimerase family protein [Planktomarina temperata]MDC1094178.1 dTDP-4-dehydrorhamnose 3,5-epimerase family protein [Planktomarina temperata]